jgi:hypothetical protein
VLPYPLTSCFRADNPSLLIIVTNREHYFLSIVMDRGVVIGTGVDVIGSRILL